MQLKLYTVFCIVCFNSSQPSASLMECCSVSFWTFYTLGSRHSIYNEIAIAYILVLIASETSFLVCSMARIFLYNYIYNIYISGRTSCRKCI